MKKNNKKFVVCISIQFWEGRYHVEFMRLKLKKDGGINKNGKSVYHHYSFSPNNEKYAQLFNRLTYDTDKFQRPSVHFRMCPTTNLYTSWKYDEKRVAEYLKGEK